MCDAAKALGNIAKDNPEIQTPVMIALTPLLTSNNDPFVLCDAAKALGNILG